jgi:hypothetical protein
MPSSGKFEKEERTGQYLLPEDARGQDPLQHIKFQHDTTLSVRALKHRLVPTQTSILDLGDDHRVEALSARFEQMRAHFVSFRLDKAPRPLDRCTNVALLGGELLSLGDDFGLGFLGLNSSSLYDTGLLVPFLRRGVASGGRRRASFLSVDTRCLALGLGDAGTRSSQYCGSGVVFSVWMGIGNLLATAGYIVGDAESRISPQTSVWRYGLERAAMAGRLVVYDGTRGRADLACRSNLYAVVSWTCGPCSGRGHGRGGRVPGNNRKCFK